jgi:hypothetical protein
MEHPSLNPSESVAAGHELSDASAPALFIFAASFLASLGLVYLLGWGSFVILERTQYAENQLNFPPSPLSELMHASPPEPRLEPEPSHDSLPRVDLMDVRFREQAQIGDNAWAWADSSHQFARIPIQTAMDLVVARGLPLILPATQPSAPPNMPPASALHGPGGIP